MDGYKIQRCVHWLFTIAVIVTLISGFGITQYRIVEPLTFGLLTKAVAFSIHTSMPVPFIILLALHIYFTVVKKRIQRNK